MNIDTGEHGIVMVHRGQGYANSSRGVSKLRDMV